MGAGGWGGEGRIKSSFEQSPQLGTAVGERRPRSGGRWTSFGFDAAQVVVVVVVVVCLVVVVGA